MIKDNQSQVTKLIDHLFRHESGKMVAVLTRIFGSGNLLLAEDLVQETLIEAIQNWTYHGIPDHPSAWLYKVAKNKALNALKRETFQKKYIKESLQNPAPTAVLSTSTDDIFSQQGINDDQLRMMFVCCNPLISKDSQIALILKTLCGFSVSEISRAFLSNAENINKRLVRARKKLKENKIPFELPSQQEIENRLEAVLEAIYLLFNEGYNASTGTHLIRYDLCREAIRLTEMIADHRDIIAKTNVYALLALMQLNTSRFKARQDESENIITLERQDRSRWNYRIMEQGFKNLNQSTKTGYISIYHILASISAYHCAAKDFESTDWKSILTLYDKLLLIDKSPLIILNRAIVISKVYDCQKAIKELDKIKEEKIMQSNYLFYAAKATFYNQLNQPALAQTAIEQAIVLAPMQSEKKLLEERLQKLI